MENKARNCALYLALKRMCTKILTDTFKYPHVLLMWEVKPKMFSARPKLANSRKNSRTVERIWKGSWERMKITQIRVTDWITCRSLADILSESFKLWMGGVLSFRGLPRDLEIRQGVLPFPSSPFFMTWEDKDRRNLDAACSLDTRMTTHVVIVM